MEAPRRLGGGPGSSAPTEEARPSVLVPFSDLVQEGSLALIGAANEAELSADRDWRAFAAAAVRERLREVVAANDDAITKSSGLLENAVAPDPQVERLEAEKIEKAHALLATLEKDEEKVLKLRFGIDAEPSTLEAVAQDLGMKRGRVSGLESRALAALRRAVHRLRWTFPR
jgi:RNA polymerase sigma factor (sigma-70 family)